MNINWRWSTSTAFLNSRWLGPNVKHWGLGIFCIPDAFRFFQPTAWTAWRVIVCYSYIVPVDTLATVVDNCTISTHWWCHSGNTGVVGYCRSVHETSCQQQETKWVKCSYCLSYLLCEKSSGNTIRLEETLPCSACHPYDFQRCLPWLFLGSRLI